MLDFIFSTSIRCWCCCWLLSTYSAIQEWLWFFFRSVFLVWFFFYFRRPSATTKTSVGLGCDSLYPVCVCVRESGKPLHNTRSKRKLHRTIAVSLLFRLPPPKRRCMANEWHWNWMRIRVLWTPYVCCCCCCCSLIFFFLLCVIHYEVGTFVLFLLLLFSSIFFCLCSSCFFVDFFPFLSLSRNILFEKIKWMAYCQQHSLRGWYKLFYLFLETLCWSWSVCAHWVVCYGTSRSNERVFMLIVVWLPTAPPVMSQFVEKLTDICFQWQLQVTSEHPFEHSIIKKL